MKSKILISGGAGFIASHLAEEELKAGNEVCCLDIVEPVKIKHLMPYPGFSYVRDDMMSGCLGDLIEQCDMFYHLAAIADPAIYCEDPIRVLKVDLEATQDAIKICHTLKKKFVFSSTSEVYGKNPQLPWTENADRLLGPTSTSRWVYATAKAVGEHYCYAYGGLGLKFVILRFFNFYGPRLDMLGQGRVIPCFLDKLLKGEDVEVVRPGTQTRCLTYIDDGVQGIMSAAHAPEAEGHVFNLGSKYEITMLELAQLMKRIGNFKSKIKLIDAEKKYGKGYDDIGRRVPECQKAYSYLDWTSRTTILEGLEKTIGFYKKEFESRNNAA